MRGSDIILIHLETILSILKRLSNHAKKYRNSKDTIKNTYKDIITNNYKFLLEVIEDIEKINKNSPTYLNDMKKSIDAKQMLEQIDIYISKVEEHIDQLKCLKAPEERQELKDETFMETYERNLIFFYSKFKQIPITLNKKRLTPNEKKELMDAIHGYTDMNDLEKMCEDLFHTKIDDFNTEFFNYEKNNGLLNAGTNYKRCSFPIGRTFSGFMSILLKSEKQLQYISDYSDHLCLPNSNKCITVATSLDSYSNLPEEGKTKDYIIVNKDYFPESSKIPINVMYDKLPLISFIIDAFLENGIIEIEPELKKRIENDYPEVYYGAHPENHIKTLKKSVNNAISLHSKTKTNVTKRNMNKAKNKLKKLMNIIITKKNMNNIKILRDLNELTLNSPITPKSLETERELKELNNSLKILNTDGHEVRIRKRIGTIRKKISAVKSMTNALKTRRSRK